MKFSTRVMLLVVCAALVPLTMSFVVSVWSSITEIKQANEQKLTAIRDIKKNQLEAQLVNVKDNLDAIANIVVAYHDELQSDNMHTLLTKLNSELHFYDIFVVSPAGEVVYTVAREADYLTNLISGPYKESGLGKLYANLKNTNKNFAAADFAPYAPSNNLPAAFVGVTQEIAGETWIVAAQFSIDSINALMQTREGMGRTGETYLVGPDKRMRSDSYLDPTGHSINASFAGTTTENGVDTAAVNAALNG
jgi:methyl-accepting chemotaxis protein